MGRAIVRDPQVFLFDEPLSNLDAKLRVQMRTEIKELHQRLKTTTVYVTHDQIEAMTMADKIVVMNDGRIEQAGAPLELYDRPANLFVAGFIGSPAMNLLPGKLVASGDAACVRLADGTLLPRRATAAGGDGQPVDLRHAARAPVARRRRAASPPRSWWSSPPAPRPRSSCRIGGTELARAPSASATTSRRASTIRLQPDLPLVHLFDATVGQAVA